MTEDESFAASQIGVWSRVFTWTPKLIGGRYVWLKYVERRRVVFAGVGGIFFEDEYRLIREMEPVE